MKYPFWSLLTISLCGVLAAQSSSPEDRPITDPKIPSSENNPLARPVPIDDLYYTRAVYDPAWSPDGKQIVFVTDMSGRLNLWRVNSSGGWPIQLTQSDERQFSPAWSPDGKWIVYQQDTAGNELWDLFAVPSDGGEIVNLTNLGSSSHRAYIPLLKKLGLLTEGTALPNINVSAYSSPAPDTFEEEFAVS